MLTESQGYGDAIEVALVNNMPDQALAATKVQFERLAYAGGQGLAINWRSYSFANQPRSDTARRYLEQSHEDIEALYRRGADALIVTGAEPRAPRIQDEPFWSDMQRLIEWARSNTVSTVWSCLAAHAAVLHLDGIERRRMNAKLSGVFMCDRAVSDWRGSSRAKNVIVPHSRYNDLPRMELERRGYKVASYSREVGVDSFWRREPSLFVFLQGHPEYDADSLLKEYRRDVIRFVSREREDYPSPPAGTFAASTITELEALRIEATTRPTPNVISKLDSVLSKRKCRSNWAGDTARLYRDWLEIVSRERKTWRITA